MKRINILYKSVLAIAIAGLFSCAKKSNAPPPEANNQIQKATYTAATACVDVDRVFRVPVGQNCLTSKGVVFARVKLSENQTGWLDTKNNIFWNDKIYRGSWQDSKTICSDNNLKLPSKEDFEASAAAGLADVFDKRHSDYENAGWYLSTEFWTSTISSVRQSGENVVYTYELDGWSVRGGTGTITHVNPMFGSDDYGATYSDVRTVCIGSM